MRKIKPWKTFRFLVEVEAHAGYTTSEFKRVLEDALWSSSEVVVQTKSIRIINVKRGRKHE